MSSPSHRFVLAAAVAASCVSGGLAARQPTAPPGTRELRFTTDEGTWLSLDVAPDGRTIAFELLGDIYTLPIDGGRARPLVTGTAFQSQPRYSKDGARLVYVSDESGADNVWIANTDGTGARAITSRPRAMMTSPAWAPDGHAIYVTVIEDRIAALWRVDVETGTGEPIVANGNGPPSLLVSTPSPGPYGAHVTADGAWLYYASVTPRPYGMRQGAASRIIRRALASGGRDELLALDLPVAMRPLVSPDGRLLVYGAQAQGRTGLRVRDLAAETERWLRAPNVRNQLEARASRDTLPGYAFTPDGRAVLAAYGGKIHRLEIASGADTVVPFTADVALRITPAPEFTRRLDDGPVRARLVQQADVAADGRVAFSALGRLYVAPPTGAATRLTATPAPREFMPAWSPDGHWVAFVTWTADGGHLWKVAAAGGAPVRLSAAPGFWADPVWTPDGQYVVALRAPVMSGRQSPFPVPSDAQLVSVPANGGAATTIAAASGARHPHFSADPSRVYLTAPDGLVSFPLSGGARTLLGAFPKRTTQFGPPLMEARLTPDGAQVVLAIADRLHRLPLPSSGTAAAVLDPDGPGAVELSRRGPLYFGVGPDGAAHWITGRTLHVLAPRESPASARRRTLDVTVPRATPTGSVVLRGGRVITMRGAQVIENADLVITGARIAAVGARGSVAVPAGARVIDVTGRTIMPGLVDLHAHWNVRRDVLEPDGTSAWANLAFGTTTVRDPQSPPDIFTYADMAEAGDVAAPRIFSTGPGVFVDTNFQSIDEVRSYLARYVEDYGTTNLKSYMAGSRRQRQWIAQVSRELGILATTEGGADDKANLTHAIDGYAGNEHALPAAPLYRDVVQLLAESGITYTPTLLVAFGGALPVFREHLQERPQDDPRLRAFFPPDLLYERTQTRLLAFPSEDYNDRDAGAGAAAVLAAGGHVGLGGHGELQGMQNHWEMRLMAQAGMPRHDVLRVATLEGARALGLTQDLGSLEPGKRADLLVLEHNPLDDIRHTTSLRFVMKNGVLYDASTLATVWPTAAPGPERWWTRELSQ